jgi:hypothetical protein
VTSDDRSLVDGGDDRATERKGRPGVAAKAVYAISNLTIVCALLGVALSAMPTRITRWLAVAMVAVLLAVGASIKKDIE